MGRGREGQEAGRGPEGKGGERGRRQGDPEGEGGERSLRTSGGRSGVSKRTDGGLGQVRESGEPAV